MISVKKRSYTRELLDQPHIPFEDIKRNMQELEFINTYLGGIQLQLAVLGNYLKTEIMLQFVKLAVAAEIT